MTTEGDGVVTRAAYMLGRVARGATNAVSIPYRAIADAGARTARAGLARMPSASPRRRARSSTDEPLPDPPPDLAEIGGPELAAALTHPDPAVRASALHVAGELPGDRAAPIVSAALLDPAAPVRCAAAVAAAQAHAYGAGFALIYALDDIDSEVRVTAAMALEELTGVGVDLTQLEDAGYRGKKVDELQRWWKRRRLDQLSGEGQP